MKRLNEKIESILALIRKQKTVFIGSVDDEGFPNIKAMFAPRKIDGNCFYFTTNTSSMHSRQFGKNPNASLYAYHRGRFKYEGLMLAGTMEVLLDDEIKREIWRAGDGMYYKQGAADPDYCVLRFTAKTGRHYCNLKTESFSIDKIISHDAGNGSHAPLVQARRKRIRKEGKDISPCPARTGTYRRRNPRAYVGSRAHCLARAGMFRRQERFRIGRRQIK